MRANQQAYAIVGQMVGSQAASLAYIDIISAMAIAILFLVPFVLIMKKPPKGARAAAALDGNERARASRNIVNS